MAVTKIMPLHLNRGKTLERSLHDRTAYALNPDKTNEGELVSSFGCDYRSVDAEFLLTKRQYEAANGHRNVNDIIAYQLIQSFAPGEVSPEEANRIGYETAARLLKGRYDFIVATHIDHLHVHNHIIWNSTANDLSQKYINRKGSFKDIQKISDLVCTEHQLSVIDNPQHGGKKYNVWLDSQKDRPQTLVDITKALSEKGVGYKNWASKHNIQQLAQAYNFMKENKISSASQIEDVIKKNGAEISKLRETARDLQGRLDKAVEMKKHLINYSKYKDIYLAYKKSGYSKKYYEEHKGQIDMVKAAKEVFKSYDGEKLPTVKEINALISRLQKQKNAAYDELKTRVGETKDLQTYADNIRSLLGEQTEEPEKKQTKRTKTSR